MLSSSLPRPGSPGPLGHKSPKPGIWAGTAQGPSSGDLNERSRGGNSPNLCPVKTRDTGQKLWTSGQQSHLPLSMQPLHRSIKLWAWVPTCTKGRCPQKCLLGASECMGLPTPPHPPLAPCSLSPFLLLPGSSFQTSSKAWLTLSPPWSYMEVVMPPGAHSSLYNNYPVLLFTSIRIPQVCP